MNILDLIFPKYCVKCKKFGDYLCADCFTKISFDTKNICVNCGKPSFDGLTHAKCMRKYSINGVFTCIVYNSVVKRMIFKFKYKPYIKNLGSYLGEFMYESLIQDEEFMRVLKKDAIFVPIPLSKKKFKQRGYNQAEVLAKELSKRFGLQVVDLLERKRETRTQVGLDKSERRANIKDAFGVKKKYSANFKNTRVILVDDVTTTGSTFSEVAKVLKRMSVREVWAVALAKES